MSSPWVIIWRASQGSDVHVHVLGINFKVSIFTVHAEVSVLRPLTRCKQVMNFQPDRKQVMYFQPDLSVLRPLTRCKQVMDFQPGEYLNVKEMHYNQHGMLILQVV